MEFDISFQKSLARLASIADRVFILPCSENEIQHFGATMRRPIPDAFISFLRQVGLVQDLTNATARTARGMKLAADRFQRATGVADFFPVIEEGETKYLMRHTDDDPIVYSSEPDRDEITPTGQSLAELVDAAVNQACSRPDRLANRDKAWRVQFSVKSGSSEPVVHALQRVAGFDDPGGDWRHRETSPAKVRVYCKMLEFYGRHVELRRQEYDRWPSPCFYLDWVEPVLQLQGGSLIRKIDDVLSRFGPSYILIDYGLMPILL